MAKILLAFVLFIAAGNLYFVAGQTSSEIPDVNLDKATKYSLIDEILSTIKEHYFSVDMAVKMETGIRQKIARREYEQITSAKVLAVALTLHLQEICGDKHVFVQIADRTDRNPEPGRNAAEENYGFTRLQILPRNIGYIEVNSLPPPEVSAETLAAVMKFVQNSSALIIDLRNNTGGAIPMVALFVSYFVPEKPVQLLTVDSPRNLRRIESWTVEKLAGPRYLGKPVVLLTGPETFSGGEEFAYDMQALKRARIIGERTKGGANPVRTFLIQNIFRLGVSFAQVQNAITGANWEGTGVKPDIESTAENALDVALTTIRKDLSEKSARSESAQPEIRMSTITEISDFPDTAIGRTFAAFLQALNSGSREKLVAFHLARLPNSEEGKRVAEENARQDLDFFQNSGGLSVGKIVTSSETKIEVIAKFKQRNEWVIFTMEVEPTAPHSIKGLNVAPSVPLK